MSENIAANELESLRRVHRRAQNLVEALRTGPNEYPGILNSEQGVEWSKLADAIKVHEERFLA